MENKSKAGSAFDSLMSPDVKVRISKRTPKHRISFIVPPELYDKMERYRGQRIARGDGSFNKTTLVLEAISQYLENVK